MSENETRPTGGREDEAARLRAVFAAHGFSAGRSTNRRPTMTPAKAQRLVNALAVVSECEDIEDGARVAFEDARAAIEPYLGES